MLLICHGHVFLLHLAFMDRSLIMEAVASTVVTQQTWQPLLVNDVVQLDFVVAALAEAITGIVVASSAA